MKELHISMDDDLYGILELYRRTVSQLTDIERSTEDFVVLLTSLGIMSLGRAMTPPTEAEMQEVILSIIGEAPERANFIQRIYELTKTQRDKRMGLTK